MPEYRVERRRGRRRSSERFARRASRLSLKQLRKLKGKAAALPGAAAEEMGYLLDAHLAMLDQFAPGARRRAAHRRPSASMPSAPSRTRSREIGESFAAMGDAYLAGARRGHPRGRRAPDPQPHQDALRRASSTSAEGTRHPRRGADARPTRRSWIRAASPASPRCWAAPRATPRSWRAPWSCRRCSASPGSSPQVESGDTVVIDGTSGAVVVNPTARHDRRATRRARRRSSARSASSRGSGACRR